MPGITDIVSLLTEIESGKKTGRLYVYSKRPAGMVVVNFSINAGELRNIYSDGFDWHESINLVLSSVIMKIMFVPGRGDTKLFDKAVSIEMPELIQMLMDSSDDTSWIDLKHAEVKSSAEYLIRGVTEVVVSLIGESGNDHVSEILNSYNPESNPRQFLDACRDSVAEVVGGDLADEAFSRLYRHGLN